ncbi:MAG TPA: DsbA family protein [Patescibacteria group bacterium]|nr:DsbA family protein [Patescibacteria group bacterium]
MTQEAKILIGIGIVSVALVVGGAFIMGGSSSSQKLTSSQEKILVRDDSNKIVAASAKATLVEFGDYQCPACGQAHPLVKRLLSEEAGKLNFVFRNFAFLGQESIWAAEGAECAGEQGKFWDYHDYLYEHQGGENLGAFSKEKLEGFAKNLNLNTEQFKMCLETDKYQQKVLNDTADGKSLGVNSTPTFFVNGVKNVGVLSYEKFKSILDAQLK